MASHYITSHVLCQEVGWLISSKHFSELEVTALDMVLYPQVRHMQVPCLAKATHSTNAYRSSGFGQYSRLEMDIEVNGQ